MHKSTKQTIVATSTCEAEYFALSECVIHLEWLRQLLKDFKMKCVLPLQVYSGDSSAAQQLAKETGTKARSKHVLIQY